MHRDPKRPSESLAELGLELPEPASPSFNYVPTLREGNLIYTSGQLPKEDGEVRITGRCGEDASLDLAQQAARICTLQGLACAAEEAGTLDAISGVLKVTGFVASTRDFHQQPAVLDSASELLRTVFGEGGRHVRSALGVASLPRNVPVEIEFIFTLHPRTPKRAL